LLQPTSACSLVITCTLHAIDATIMHRIITLLACTTALTPTPGRTRDAALTQTRVRTRVMTDGEILRRSAEVGPLVRAFSVGQRGRGSGVSTLNVAEASALKAATDELIAKRQKCDGSVIVAQKNRQLVGFALVNDDVLETVAVAVDERGRGVGAQLVDAAGALASSGGNDELLVEVEPQNGRGRNFFEGLGFASTGERRGTLAVLSKPLPWRPPALVVSFVIGLPVVVALAGMAASGDAFDVEGVVAAASALVAQLDVEGALGALADRLPSI
jgi:ribosomal protein S18 acetylase RimI-like enzyme